MATNISLCFLTVLFLALSVNAYDGNDTYYTTVMIPMVTTTRSTGKCPTYFHELNGRCYLFSQSIGLHLVWDDARLYCVSHSIGESKYDLLILDNDVEEPLMINNEMSRKRYYNATIGARYMGLSLSKWTWNDGAEISMLNPMWDCSYPQSKESSSCGMLAFTYDSLPSGVAIRLRLRDVSPNNEEFFICEGDLIY